MAESETVPTEVCEKIVAMRKDGLTMNAVAKELDLSIRNVQRVWQRYQVTGRIDDKRRSSGVGRPRKHSESSKVSLFRHVLSVFKMCTPILCVAYCVCNRQSSHVRVSYLC